MQLAGPQRDALHGPLPEGVAHRQGPLTDSRDVGLVDRIDAP